MHFTKQTIPALVVILAAFSLSAQQLPSKAADSDALATEAESKVNKAVEATQEAKKPATTGTANQAETRTAGSATARSTGSTTSTTSSSDSLSPVLYNDGRMNYATSATKFQLTAADSLSNIDYIEYRIDDSPFMRYNEPFSIDQEGPRRIVYRAVDKAGNREADNVFMVTIDNTPPTVTANLNGPSYPRDGVTYVSTSTKIELYAKDVYSGVKKIEYAINDGDFVEGNSIVLDQPGRQRVRYRASDNLNNVSAEQQIATMLLDVDNTTPTVAIRTSRRPVEFEGKKYALRDTIYTVEAVDEGAGIDKILVRIDGEGDFQPYTTPIQFSNEGPHSIEAKAIDRVGNESEIAKLDIITDDDPPTSSIKVVGQE